MRKLTDHDAPAAWSRSPFRRAFGFPALALLMALTIAGLIGCAKKEEPPATPAATEESPAGATSTITLNWDRDSSCVDFAPPSSSIMVGDRVNFNSSMDDTVRVHVPAGLFSVGDTTIIVVRGANETSPQARSFGTYELSSTPAACQGIQGGGGPSIIVNSGTGTP